MDKTPKYQKMCVEAFKDIGYIKPTISSNLMIPASNSIHNQQADDFMLTFEDEFDNIGFGSTVARPVGQLYQQDQLQDFLNEEQNNILGRLSLFCEWIVESLEPVGIYASDEYDSLEQLWLAYVMKERYQKIWDNKEPKWTHS